MGSTLDEAGRARVQQRADEEFVRRTLDHVPAVPVLLLLLYLYSRFARDYSGGFWFFTAITLGTCALRILVGHFLFPTLYGRRPRFTVHFLGGLYLTSTLAWGTLGGVIVYLYGFDTWTTFFILFTIAGVAGTTQAGASTFREYLIVIYVGLCGPTFAAALWRGGEQGVSVAACSLIFAVMMILQGKRRNCVYWDHLEANELLRRHAEELEEARLRAEDASRAKSDFLANVSHELRTPMNGVLGMTRLAMESGVSGKARGFVETAHESALSLLHLLNDILDFSKIEAGKLALSPRDFDLRDVLGSVERLFLNETRRRNLEFTLDSSAWITARLHGDPDRLRQVLINLVGNAVKFTEAGSIRLVVSTRGQADHGQELEFEVSDTGIGIPEDQQKAIFEAFSQLDSSSRRERGGTGLGLSISARLVELMGGRIWVESTPGVGSSFRFTAHFETGEGELAPHRDEVPKPIVMPARLRVLVAEDHPVNVKLILAVLEGEHHDAIVVSRGDEAVAAYQAGDFDLVLMDVQMPGLDGLEATAKIREWEQAQGRSRKPIIALTANAMRGDREKCLAAGMDGYLAKPVQLEALLELLTAIRPAGATLPAS